jgi:hypothetical protein
MSIQVGFQPGTLNVVGQGTATNVNPGQGFGAAF